MMFKENMNGEMQELTDRLKGEAPWKTVPRGCGEWEDDKGKQREKQRPVAKNCKETQLTFKLIHISCFPLNPDSKCPILIHNFCLTLIK